MPNLFDEMASGKHYEDILNSLANTPADELQQAAAAVTDEQLPWVFSYVDKTMRSSGVLDTIVCGALLHAMTFVGEAANRQELVGNLYEDLSISRTQGYRCIQVWRQFGAQLMTEPKLKRGFCAESLKILAEDRTPQAARDEALQLSRDGDKITMKVAESLLVKHGAVSAPVVVTVTEPAVSSPQPAKKRGRKSHKWLFVGEAVRIEVVPTASGEITDFEPVIRDLQSAIDQLRSGGQGQQVA